MLKQNDRYYEAKKLFPEMLKRCFGNVSQACKELNISRNWLYENFRDDPKFKAACDEAGEVVLDFVESRLFNQIKNDNTQATIFFLKTRGSHRGYGEVYERFIGQRDDGDDAIDVSPTKEQRYEIVRLCNETTSD